MTTWLTDNRGNKCSVEYWGSYEEAQKALNSLKDCDNCINCSRCSRCSDCSGCRDCLDCLDCWRCWRCSDCSGCVGCSNCSGCLRCLDCLDCLDCSDCLHSSHCSVCSGCSGCRDCLHIAFMCAKKGLAAEPGKHATSVPPIPKIENINQRIYEAVSQPEALNMNDWHTCDTTHCRAGWAVHLAGDAGYALEQSHGSLLAAQLIYRESGSPISPIRFFDSKAEALADMKRAAEVEAARG